MEIIVPSIPDEIWTQIIAYSAVYPDTRFCIIQVSKSMCRLAHASISRINMHYCGISPNLLTLFPNLYALSTSCSIANIPVISRLLKLRICKSCPEVIDLSAARLTSLSILTHTDVILPMTIVKLVTICDISLDLTAYTNLQCLEILSGRVTGYDRLPLLRSLRITGNCQNIETMTQLDRLSIINNSSITTLPPNITRLYMHECQKLDLSAQTMLSRLKIHHSDVGKLPSSLTMLNINSPRVTPVGHLTNLRTLIVLDMIHPDVTSLTRLEILHMGYRKQEFTSSFPFSSLRTLKVSSWTHMSTIRAEISTLSNLRKLKLGAGCALSVYYLVKLPMIESLSMTSWDTYQKGVEALTSLTNLTSLSVPHANCIEGIDFTMLSSLRKLKLELAISSPVRLPLYVALYVKKLNIPLDRCDDYMIPRVMHHHIINAVTGIY